MLPETNDSIKNKYQNTKQKDIDNNPDKSNINPDNKNNILPNKADSSIQGITSNVNNKYNTLNGNNLTPVQNNLTSVNSNITQEQQHTCMKNKTESCPHCPACARTPQSMFEYKKVPKYGESLGNTHLPRPILTDFSTFGM
jgi:uncharacterized protein YbcC (UPF0753/DUF2309 family)